jgi:hypothetical protein
MTTIETNEASENVSGSVVVPAAENLENFYKIGAFGGVGSSPLGYWTALTKQYDFRTAHVYVELYYNPLNLYWGTLANNKRAQVTRSVADLGAAYPQIKGQVSAVVVRPGPKFERDKLYKVTLYNLVNYRGYMLTLTFGTYPDLFRYAFDNLANSLLIEATVADYKQIPIDAQNYYDVASYYIPHTTRSSADAD